MGGADQRLLYWRETTDASLFETGIQRVTRRLGGGLGRLGTRLVAVGFDPQRRLIRPLASAPPGWTAETAPDAGPAWLFVPEIPMTVLGLDLDPVQLARAYGLRTAAIVHDLIPVRLPHLYSPEAATLYRRYYRMFADADLVLATTDLVAGHLRAHLTGEGLRVPEMAVVPLPAQFADLPRVSARPPPREGGAPLRLLTVSTWEPRKNLAGLLRAVRLARASRGAPIHLTLVGRRDGHADHDAEVDALLAELPGCRAIRQADDAALAALHASHHASVYPSCEEGFGMPVLESLWLGRPCLCHAGSAMAEVAPGGGALLVDMTDEGAIADALVRLVEDPGLLDRLTEEALARPLRDWDEYAGEVAVRLGVGVRRAVPPVSRFPHVLTAV